MLRHYYISSDLNDLQAIEQELEQSGLSTPQIHVLSENDAAVEKHHLHAIEAVLKQDVVRSTQLGAVAGLIGAAFILGLTYAMQWHTSIVGWLPSGFLAVVVLGFCTWEGGLVGIQIPNYQFKRFQALLKQGKHVFFVDVGSHQVNALKEVVERHPSLIFAGTGDATPSWVIKGQDKYSQAMKALP
ncbi:NAD/FAD-utilizing enzyme [uncultured Paraglaciecola sp.]|uniref:NAD/FAD-utilizing enzyme n=1 Tax=uncultured Paraglaciecola sp. TaxID=1765024 RepID=UPI0026356439|nr:NAD/FAD-utilizing enzyme [uncultured Paraglaciecola sp.]